MDQVEMKLAFAWYYEECSELNFCLPQKAELTKDEREDAFRQEHLLDEFSELPDHWDCSEYMCIPEQVACNNCGTEFEAVDESPPEEFDEEWP